MFWQKNISSYLHNNISHWPIFGLEIVQILELSNFPDQKTSLAISYINRYKYYKSLNEIIEELK